MTLGILDIFASINRGLEVASILVVAGTTKPVGATDITSISPSRIYGYEKERRRDPYLVKIYLSVNLISSLTNSTKEGFASVAGISIL